MDGDGDGTAVCDLGAYELANDSTPPVSDLAEIVSDLIDAAAALDFQQGVHLLQNALRSLNRDNTDAACAQVSAFINQVEAQSGKASGSRGEPVVALRDQRAASARLSVSIGPTPRRSLWDHSTRMSAPPWPRMGGASDQQAGRRSYRRADSRSWPGEEIDERLFRDGDTSVLCTDNDCNLIVSIAVLVQIDATLLGFPYGHHHFLT